MAAGVSSQPVDIFPDTQCDGERDLLHSGQVNANKHACSLTCLLHIGRQPVRPGRLIDVSDRLEFFSRLVKF